MSQATGYARSDLHAPLTHLMAIHEQCAANAQGFPGPDGLSGKWGVLRHKFTQPRFLNILRVPPFTPHSGGSIFTPADLAPNRHARLGLSPLAAPAFPLQHPAAGEAAQPEEGEGANLLLQAEGMALQGI